MVVEGEEIHLCSPALPNLAILVIPTSSSDGTQGTLCTIRILHTAFKIVLSLECYQQPVCEILTIQVFFFFVCFTSFFVFRIADLPHSPGVLYYHLLLRRETRIPGVAPFSFRIGIWDLFLRRKQKSYTPTSCGPLQK